MPHTIYAIIFTFIFLLSLGFASSSDALLIASKIILVLLIIKWVLKPRFQMPEASIQPERSLNFNSPFFIFALVIARNDCHA